MTDFEHLIPVAVDFRREGHRIALVTLVGSSGSSPRPIGSQMVVAEDGRSVGYLTGGCAEGVIVNEALAALAESRNRHLRLGAGSPYIDVRLPCGAGIDLFIDTDVGDDVLETLNTSIGARVPVALDTDMANQGNHECVFELSNAIPPECFRRWFYPRRRLVILGKGPNVLALTRMGLTTEYEVLVISPDIATLKAGEEAGAEVCKLLTPSAFSCPSMDPWTAAVTLFHEHDWEPVLLEAILATDCFYTGALGSRRAHQYRLQSLAERGIADAGHRLHGPVGMALGAATPMEIAISILAEITKVYRKTARPLLTVSQKQQSPQKAG